MTSHSEPSFKTAESTGHFRKKPAFVSKKKSSTFTSKPSTVTSDFQNIPISPTNHSTPVTKVTNLENERDVIAVKLELPSGDQSSVLVSLNKDIEHGHLEAVESTTSNKVLQLETSSHITDVSDKTSENENNKTQVFDSSEIKVEPANEEDLDLEITGVEMAAEDMGDNTNWTAGSGFGSSTSDFQSEAVDTGVQTGAYSKYKYLNIINFGKLTPEYENNWVFLSQGWESSGLILISGLRTFILTLVLLNPDIQCTLPLQTV